MEVRKIFLAVVVASLLTIPSIPSMKASHTLNVAVVDIECVSGFITYDKDEQFRAKIFNSGNSVIHVAVEWRLDGRFVTRKNENLSPLSYSWTPPVIIHWPDDFRLHTITAKVIISDSDQGDNKRDETYRASFITSIMQHPIFNEIFLNS